MQKFYLMYFYVNSLIILGWASGTFFYVNIFEVPVAFWVILSVFGLLMSLMGKQDVKGHLMVFIAPNMLFGLCALCGHVSSAMGMLSPYVLAALVPIYLVSSLYFGYKFATDN